ncbi:hypothetical protein [Oceanobacillus salinisoli]|uniref:hypothetical protein n=1 Tax=Oceanobacillus salinisoli TaxID=2678611 RepID=UPI0018CC37B0|nr:hypothetical protein [Oceanobacillus salinisoli]
MHSQFFNQEEPFSTQSEQSQVETTNEGYENQLSDQRFGPAGYGYPRPRPRPRRPFYPPFYPPFYYPAFPFAPYPFYGYPFFPWYGGFF